MSGVSILVGSSLTLGLGLFLLSVSMKNHRDRFLRLTGTFACRGWVLRAVGWGLWSAGGVLLIRHAGGTGFGLLSALLISGLGVVLVAVIHAGLVQSVGVRGRRRGFGADE